MTDTLSSLPPETVVILVTGLGGEPKDNAGQISDWCSWWIRPLCTTLGISGGNILTYAHNDQANLGIAIDRIVKSGKRVLLVGHSFGVSALAKVCTWIDPAVLTQLPLIIALDGVPNQFGDGQNKLEFPPTVHNVTEFRRIEPNLSSHLAPLIDGTLDGPAWYDIFVWSQELQQCPGTVRVTHYVTASHCGLPMNVSVITDAVNIMLAAIT